MCFIDFKNAKELLALCQKKKLPISEVMRQREILLGETTAEIVDQRMDRVLEIMKDAAFSPIKDPVISMGGLIGGEARKLCEFHDLGKSLCGNVLGKGITYAMATLEMCIRDRTSSLMAGFPLACCCIFPARLPHPIPIFFRAPPKPVVSCPLKWLRL